jgi:lysophospholipase L1-like esterase
MQRMSEATHPTSSTDHVTPGSPPGRPGSADSSKERTPRGKRSLGRRLLLSIGTVAFVIGVLEISLRVGYLIRHGTWDFLPTVRMASELYEAHPYLCYVMRPNVHFSAADMGIQTNRWGFRGQDVSREKPAGVVRIACLGGSTTFSLNASDNDHTWPAQLERILNERYAPTRFEVLNFGTPGYCSIESFLIFALRGLDFAPDVVLIQDALNDVRAVARPDAVLDFTHYRSPYTRIGSRWLGKSAVGRLLIGAAVKINQPGYSGRYTLSERGVRLFQHHVESTALLARSRGIEPVIVTMPDALPDDEAKCRERNAEVMLARVLIQSLRQLGRRRDIPLVDLAVTFPKDPELFADDTHKTDRGLELAARMIADGLQENGVLPRVLQRQPSGEPR